MEKESQNAQLEQIVQSAEEIQPQVTTVTAMEYAGFWVRFAASLVDGAILLIPMVIVNFIFGKMFGDLMGSVLMWAYAIYMLSTRQATYGKMAVGIKVMTIKGEKLTVGNAALREIVGKILNIFTLYVGFIMVAFTEKKQGLHDKLAGTVVVYDPAKKKRRWLVVLGICIGMILPVALIMTIILISLQSARDKALNKANEARQEAQRIDAQLQNQN